jgi:hypothetical protein
MMEDVNYDTVHLVFRRILLEQRSLHLSQPPLQEPQCRWNLCFVLPPKHRIVPPNQQVCQHPSLQRCLLPEKLTALQAAVKMS